VPRVVTAAAGAIVLAVSGTSLAWADTNSGKVTSGGSSDPVLSADHGTGDPGATGPSNTQTATHEGGGAGHASSGPTCTPTYTAVDPSDVKYIVMANPHLPGTELPDPNGGDYYFIDGCGYSGHVVFVPRPSSGVPGNPAAALPVDPAALAVQAEKQFPLPNPHIRMNPDPASGTDQLTGLTTWLWVQTGDLATKSDSVNAGPVVVTATATATATQVVWNMGDGHTITCVGPGTPYAASGSPTCSYTYLRSSSSQPGEAYTITATVNWAVSCTVAGAPGGGTLPAITRASSTAVRVAEQQAINTPS